MHDHGIFAFGAALTPTGAPLSTSGGAPGRESAATTKKELVAFAPHERCLAYLGAISGRSHLPKTKRVPGYQTEGRQSYRLPGDRVSARELDTPHGDFPTIGALLFAARDRR